MIGRLRRCLQLLNQAESVVEAGRCTLTLWMDPKALVVNWLGQLPMPVHTSTLSMNGIEIFGYTPPGAYSLGLVR